MQVCKISTERRLWKLVDNLRKGLRGGKKHQQSGEYQAILKKQDSELMYPQPEACRNRFKDMHMFFCDSKIQVSLVGQIEKRKKINDGKKITITHFTFI